MADEGGDLCVYFGGGGWTAFHFCVGVAAYLQDAYPGTGRLLFAGVSAGALVAATLADVSVPATMAGIAVRVRRRRPGRWRRTGSGAPWRRFGISTSYKNPPRTWQCS